MTPANDEHTPAWLDVHGASVRAAVSEATILRAARSGALRAYKVGLGRSRWRVRPSDVDAWVMHVATPELVRVSA